MGEHGGEQYFLGTATQSQDTDLMPSNSWKRVSDVDLAADCLCNRHRSGRAVGARCDQHSIGVVGLAVIKLDAPTVL